MIPSTKMCFCLCLNDLGMPIISVYIGTILDRAGCQPLWSSPVLKVAPATMFFHETLFFFFLNARVLKVT